MICVDITRFIIPIKTQTNTNEGMMPSGKVWQRLGDAHVWYDVVWSCAFVVRQTHGYVN